MDDAAQLLEWRNDPDAIGASFNARHIGEDEHRQWLERVLDAADHIVWVAVSDGGDDIGVVRAHRLFGKSGVSSVAELSVIVAPEFRGRGYASEILDAAVNEMLDEEFAERFIAQVKYDNPASIKAFRRARFIAASSFVTLRRDFA